MTLREYVPAAETSVYLNTGTAGPLLRPVADAMQAAAHQELLTGRIGREGFITLIENVSATRALLAQLLGATTEEIGITHHTTEGMNIVSLGLPWKSGDRVLTTTLEHGGGLLPLYQLHKRWGVDVDFADIGRGEPDATLEAIGALLKKQPKLVVLSHVTYGTGATLPLAEITRLAHDHGALIAVDGAQSVGAMDLDMKALDVDFYAFPGQKWLCGPEGTGGLFVKRELLDDLAVTFTGFFGIDHDAYRADDVRSLLPAPSAARYEVGSVYRPGIVGLLNAVRWHVETGAEHNVTAIISDLASYAINKLSEIPEVEVLTPTDSHSGLVSFLVSGIGASDCVARLAEANVAIRSIPENGALRLSCGFFNTTQEIDTVLDLIQQYCAAEPSGSLV